MEGVRRKPRQHRPQDKDTAFRLLFRDETIELVWSWLARLEVPLWDRMDVLQEALFNAFRSFPAYDPMRARPARWLNKITVYTAAHYRDLARHRREVLAEDLEEVMDERPDASDRIMAEQARAEVFDALQTLEPELRSVLVAHDIDGIPMVEIAEQHGIPVSTAYKRRARALARFHAAVEQRGREEQPRDDTSVPRSARA